MKNIRVIVCICIALAAFAAMGHAADDAENNYKPKGGYVPDAETAIAIAVAV